MKLTTIDIIKILPFEDGFKKSLLAEFDQLEFNKKFDMEQVIWNTYEALYKIKLQENLDVALSQFGTGDEKLDPEFYKKIQEQTHQEMQSESVQVSTDVDLDATREKLQELIRKNDN